MSRCRLCGDPVTWAEKSFGGWHRPLEPIATGIGVQNGTVLPYPMTIYRVHECDEDKIAEYAVERAAVEEAQREEQEAWEQLIAAARVIECPLPRGCGAPPDSPCWSLVYLKSGRQVANKNFHHARLAAAEKTIGEEVR
jgi:hypothetical protein